MSFFRATYCKHVLQFKGPAQTSRDTLYEKSVYYLLLESRETGLTGIGECTTIPGLSPDDHQDYEAWVRLLCDQLNEGRPVEELLETWADFPSIKFGLEVAYWDWQNGGKRLIFDTPFAYGQRSIPINGLVWMGDFAKMEKQIREKLEAGFDCIKLKIGAIDWEKELHLLKQIRESYSEKVVAIRVDANGAFLPKEAQTKLEQLSQYKVHSIEQPIKPGQWEVMNQLCRNSPVPIALDEELIGARDKKALLDAIEPHYLILKSGLIGGFREADEWIRLAASRDIGWWATSALESNIGLNAIAQWTDTYKVKMPQGLGTGGLYTNNIPAPLEVSNGVIWVNSEEGWDLSGLKELNY